MSPDLQKRVALALHDAERWVGKFIADNTGHDGEPGHPVLRARRALERIADVRSEFEALQVRP